MSDKIVLFYKNNKIITFHYENNTLADIFCDDYQHSVMGNVYIGKIQNIVNNINSAFVYIQKDLVGYLPLDHCKNSVIKKNNDTDTLHIGDEIIVQVEKDRIKTKEAALTTNLTFQGKYIILTIENKKIGFSAKLNKSEKETLKKMASPYLNEQYGYIVRTGSKELIHNPDGQQILQKEIAYLNQICEDVLLKADSRTVFSCLYSPASSYITRICNYEAGNIEKIVTDNKALYTEISDYLKKQYCDFLPKLQLYEDESYPISKLYATDTRLSEVTSKNVWLKCGGYLVIEPTEALTVIDVNSGKFVTKKQMEDSIFKVNAEAAVEIARQLRLRNLSGIIIIDFINMQSKEHISQLLQLLKSEFVKDKVPTQIAGITALGLVEITRKRILPSLYELLFGLQTDA